MNTPQTKEDAIEFISKLKDFLKENSCSAVFSIENDQLSFCFRSQYWNTYIDTNAINLEETTRFRLWRSNHIDITGEVPCP